LITGIFIISCTSRPENKPNYVINIINGVENIINNNEPSIPVDDMKINFKATLTVNGTSDSTDTSSFRTLSYFTVDLKGNIYIFDENLNKVFKFDNLGKFVTTFGRRGAGPGEFIAVGGITCLNDTLFIVDSPVKKMNRFDTEGNFLNTSMIPGTPSLYNNFCTVNGMLLMQRLSIKKNENNLEMYKLTEIRESNLKKLALFDSSYIEYPPQTVKEELSISRAIAADKNYFYIADKGDFFDYKIKVLNRNGEKQKIIKKKFSRLKISEKELNQNIADLLDNGLLESKNDSEEYKLQTDYKPSIRWIFCDKLGRLWVNESRLIEDPADKRMKFSIFENGIYLNSILLNLDVTDPNMIYDVLSTRDLQFLGNKIYALNRNENRLTVYEY
jgi:hypothetical protein